MRKIIWLCFIFCTFGINTLSAFALSPDVDVSCLISSDRKTIKFIFDNHENRDVFCNFVSIKAEIYDENTERNLGFRVIRADNITIPQSNLNLEIEVNKIAQDDIAILKVLETSLQYKCSFVQLPPNIRQEQPQKQNPLANALLVYKIERGIIPNPNKRRTGKAFLTKDLLFEQLIQEEKKYPGKIPTWTDEKHTRYSWVDINTSF